MTAQTIAYLLAAFSVSCYAVLTPLAKWFGLELPPFAFVAASSAILTLVAGICSYFGEKELSFGEIQSTTWAKMLVFSLINFAGYVVYLKAIKDIPSVNYQLMYLLTPFIVAVSAYFILGERVETRQMAGFAVMVCGLCIAIWPKA